MDMGRSVFANGPTGRLDRMAHIIHNGVFDAPAINYHAHHAAD